MILASVFELYSGFDRGGFGTGPGLRVNHSWSDGFGSTMLVDGCVALPFGSSPAVVRSSSWRFWKETRSIPAGLWTLLNLWLVD